MPELPDLTVYAENLKKCVLDRTIADALVVHGGRIKPSPPALVKAAQGAFVADIVRIGKELIFSLSNDKSFAVHLMLSGRFHLTTTAEAEALPGRIVTFAFEDGDALTVSDPSKLCKLTLNPKKSTVPDVLSDEFDRAAFARAARKYAWLNVKAFLTDQKIMLGIGNAYADEILFRANISPEEYVGRIPPEALSELWTAIRDTLTDAITSIRAIAPDIIGGEERSFLKVHHPDKKETDAGDLILVKEIAGKKTYYTARQRRFR